MNICILFVKKGILVIFFYCFYNINKILLYKNIKAPVGCHNEKLAWLYVKWSLC